MKLHHEDFDDEDPAPLYRLYVGIDPGVGGGIAFLRADGSPMRAARMPETDRDLLEFLETAGGETGNRGQAVAVMERVSAGLFGARKQGQRMGVTSAFSFGRGVGALEMALCAAKIPYDRVSPVTWQTALGCRTRGDKNVSKARAQQLFPDVKCTHAISDALLLAEYCRRTRLLGG